MSKELKEVEEFILNKIIDAEDKAEICVQEYEGIDLEIYESKIEAYNEILYYINNVNTI